MNGVEVMPQSVQNQKINSREFILASLSEFPTSDYLSKTMDLLTKDRCFLMEGFDCYNANSSNRKRFGLYRMKLHWRNVFLKIFIILENACSLRYRKLAVPLE